MLFERIESQGLAHYSYLIGDQGEAIVIDPRRDADIYLERTSCQGYRLAHILETHRNEDYLIGSLELAARTEADIWHADIQWAYQYGQPVLEGQRWQIGGLVLEALHAPGHTPGMMNYLLYNSSGEPWVLFSGDTLFAGDVGRVDLLGPDRTREMASLLYDTLFHRLLPLGDEVIVCPAHGAGSVCGAAIAERVWTTIGLERRLNPRLQHKHKDDFIADVAQSLELPPYFLQMEKLNVAGPPLLKTLPMPTPLAPDAFADRAQESLILDTRMEVGFGTAHVPGALSIWLDGLPSFAGWFLPYNRPLLLVNETNAAMQAVRYLIRLGYDNLAGYLSGGMLAWHKAGHESQSIKTETVQQLCRRLDTREKLWLLDVRSEEELQSKGQIPGAHHIHITQLPRRLKQVPRDQPVHIFCGSGLRSMIGASILQREGWSDLTVVLGGFAGWNSASYPIKREREVAAAMESEWPPT